MDLNDISTNITFPSQSVYQFDAKKKKKRNAYWSSKDDIFPKASKTGRTVY